MAGPLIVTAELGSDDFAWLNGLRRQHYPADRNVVPAHMSLFRALPPSAEAEIRHVLAEIASQLPERGTAKFRLLSETEWEYAARGGPFWRDSFTFSGSNDIGQVGWYDRNSRGQIHDVAQRAPNQVGTYDMSGNVWEWCQDAFTRDISLIPGDGMPCEGPAVERVLRGGCFNNWAIHCTVSKRYEIGRDYADESIGFRLALSIG